MHGLCCMYKPQMKADKGSPSRGGHSKNPCISLRSSAAVFSNRPRQPKPGRRAPLPRRPCSCGPESLSCLCILGHRLRFNAGIAVSHGHSRDSRPTRPGSHWAVALLPDSGPAPAEVCQWPVTPYWPETQVQVPVAGL